MHDIPIVYANDDFVVVNKPHSLSVHNSHSQPGLVTLVNQQLGTTKLWLVHRLDKVTSGLLILAKTEKVASQFGTLFERKSVQKFYFAVSEKKPKKKQGTIKGDMRKIRDGKWILDKDCHNPAITQFFCHSLGPKIRLFIVKPYTGKTHQIRTALKSLGSPILGDCLYGAQPSDRTYLHAFKLIFSLAGETYRFSCLPDSGHFFELLTEQSLPEQVKHPEDFPWPKIKGASR